MLLFIDNSMICTFIIFNYDRYSNDNSSSYDNNICNDSYNNNNNNNNNNIN